ncbi:hypothetical protein BU16DRAFT_554541 [Lophium mytilinum]|uniref:Uncharacterized protein n=1 Tax=Lophium mytilinum TaxID=390894 RepID=A0A6A6RDK5_9PEZI|nr:hypothetical protein BU16DRAFT_554541 [Lophium mytilinum]
MAAAVQPFPRSCQSSSLHASINVKCWAGWHAHQRVSDVSQRRFRVPRNDPRCHQVRGGSSPRRPLEPGCWTGQVLALIPPQLALLRACPIEGEFPADEGDDEGHDDAALQGEPLHHPQRTATGGHGLAEHVSELRVALQLLAIAILAAVSRYQADPAESIPRDMHYPGAHPSPDDLVTYIQAGRRPKRRKDQIQLVARSPQPFPICVSPTPPWIAQAARIPKRASVSKAGCTACQQRQPPQQPAPMPPEQSQHLTSPSRIADTEMPPAHRQ